MSSSAELLKALATIAAAGADISLLKGDSVAADIVAKVQEVLSQFPASQGNDTKDQNISSSGHASTSTAWVHTTSSAEACCQRHDSTQSDDNHGNVVDVRLHVSDTLLPSVNVSIMCLPMTRDNTSSRVHNHDDTDLDQRVSPPAPEPQTITSSVKLPTSTSVAPAPAGSGSSLTAPATRIPSLPPLSAAQLALPHGHPSAHRADALAFLAHRQPSPLDAAVLPVFARTLAQSDRALAALALGRSAAVSHISLREQELAAPVHQRLAAATADLARLTMLAGSSDDGDDSGGVEDEAERASAREQLSTCRARVSALTDELRAIEAAAAAIRTQASQEHQRSVQAYTRSTAQQLREVWACAQLQPNTLRGAVVTLHMPERQCARQRATAAQWAASQRARQARVREQREQRDAQAAGRHVPSAGHVSTAEEGTRLRGGPVGAEGAVREGVDASVRVRSMPSGACEADVLALVTLPATDLPQLDARAASSLPGATQTHPSDSPAIPHTPAAAAVDASTPSAAVASAAASTAASTSTSTSTSSSSSAARYPAVFPAMAHLAFSHSPAQAPARDGSHSGRRPGVPPRAQEPIEERAYSYNSVRSAASPPARAHGDHAAASADALPSASVLTSLPALQQYLSRALAQHTRDAHAHALKRSPSPSSASSTLAHASLAVMPRAASSPLLRLTLPLTLPPPRLPLSVPLTVALLPHFTASPALAEATGTAAPLLPLSSTSLSSQAARIALSSVTSRLLHSTSAPLALYSPPLFLARARQAPPTHLTWLAHNVNKEDAALLAAKAAQACGLSLVNPINEASVTSLPPHSALCPVPAALRVPTTATLADVAAQVPSLLRHSRPAAAAPAGEFDGDECVVDLEGDAARYSMRSLRSYVARKLGDVDGDTRGRASTAGSNTPSAVAPRTRTRSRGHHRSVRDVMLRAARQGPHCADWELLEWGAGASLEVRFVPEEWVAGVGEDAGEDAAGAEAGAAAGSEKEVRMHDGGAWLPEAHALVEAQRGMSASEDADVRVQLRAADVLVEDVPDVPDTPVAEPLQTPGPVPVCAPVALQRTHAALGLALPTMTPNDADALHTTTGPLPSHARFAAGPVDAAAVPLVVEVPPAVPSAPLAAQALCAVVQQAQLLADQRARSEALDSPLQATFADAAAPSDALLSVPAADATLPIAVTVRAESQPTATVRLPLSHLREWHGTPCVADLDRLEASLLIAAAATLHAQSCAAHAPYASVRPCSPLCASLLRARTIDARAPATSAHAHGPALAAWLRVVSAELLPAPSASTPLLSLRPSTLRADVAVRAWMQRRFAEKAVATAPGVVAPGPHAQCECGSPMGVCACELLVDADLHTLASLPLTLPLAFDVSIRGPVRLRGDGPLRCYEHHTHRALLCKLLQADEDVSIDEEDDERADADGGVSPGEDHADADAWTPSAARHSHSHDECVPSVDVYRAKDEWEVRARLSALMFGWHDAAATASDDGTGDVAVAVRAPPSRAAMEVIPETSDAPTVPEVAPADPTGASDAVEGADFLLPQTHVPHSNTEDTAAAARSLAGDENFSPLSSPLRSARTVADTVAHTVTDLRNTATSLLGGALAAGRNIGVSFWRGRRPEQDSDVPPHPSRTSLLKPAGTTSDTDAQPVVAVSSSPRSPVHTVPSPRLSAPPAYSLPALLAMTPMPVPAPRNASRKGSRAGADVGEGVGVRGRSRKARATPPLSASALQSLLLHKPPSAPPASFLDQQVSFANAARTARLYEQYFVLCLTCRLPSLCPPCGMRCHRGHRLLSWSALTAAREHVKAAAALAELQRAGVMRVPRQWLWPDAVDTAPSPVPAPALSPLALALLLLLQIARALPAIMGTRLLRTACPALSAQARARALLVPRWALYSDWHEGILFHDTGIVQRRSSDDGEEMGRPTHAGAAGACVVEEEVKFRRCVCDAACGWPSMLQPWEWDVYGSSSAQADEAQRDDGEDEDEDSAMWRMVQQLRRRRCAMGPYAGLTADPIVAYAVEGQWPERAARAYAHASTAAEAESARGAVAVVTDGPPPLTSPQRLSTPAPTAGSPPAQLAVAAPLSASGRPQHRVSPAASPPTIAPSQPSLVSSIPPSPALSFYTSMGYASTQTSRTAAVPPAPSAASAGPQQGMQPSTYSLAQQAQPASSTFARVRMQQQRATAVVQPVPSPAPATTSTSLPPLVNAHEFDDLDSVLRAPARLPATSGVASYAHVPAQSPPPAYSAPPTHTHHHHHHAPRAPTPSPSSSLVPPAPISTTAPVAAISADLEATRARYWRCVIALEDMGFPVDDAVLRLIDRYKGNADAVVDVLLRSDTAPLG